MPTAQLILQRATKLPLLGLKAQPSPYVIIECENKTYVSPIFKYSQNPLWDYHCSLQAQQLTSYVHFYVYNNNTNGVDELLAYGRLQFSQLLTQTNTQSKTRLINSLQEVINSYLYFQHYDSNPRDLYLPLTARSAIKLKLINQLYQGHELICEYGEQSFSLRKELAQNAFRYDPKEDSISFRLRNNADKYQQEIGASLLVRNITENSFFTLKFYGVQSDIPVYISASVVITGLLPENHNVLGVKLKQVRKSSGKTVANLRVKLYGPLNSCLLQQQGKVYVENNSAITLDYFEKVEIIEGAQPYCSFKVPINSLNWEESMKTSLTLKYYDNYKNVETALIFDLQLYKATDISPVVPKPNPPQQQIDESSAIAVSQFRITNCYLYEVLKASSVQLVHIDQFNQVKTVQRFQLKENKAEYVIDTKLLLRNGGKGCLYMLCLDYNFADSKEEAFENKTVFKVNLQGVKSLQESRVEFTHKFLAFAKKNSVVNICKKFNQMVHESLCTIKTKSQLRGQIQRGSFKLINMKCTGPYGDIQVRLRVDGTQFRASGSINSYLLERPFQIEVKNGHTYLYSQVNSIQKGSENNDEKTEACLHGSLQEFFGTPDKHKTYMYELKMTSSHKLQIVYTYEPSLDKPPPKRQQPLSLFVPSTSLLLRLVRAYTPISNQTYKFTINRASYNFSSLSYKTNNSKVQFNPCQRLFLKAQANNQQQLIFLSAQSHDEENNLMIYNGYTSISSILGRGEYQVTLVYQKQDKRKEIFLTFEVFHSLPSKAQGIKLKLNQLSFNQKSNIIRTIYKYYLLVKINGFQYDIIECSVIEQSLKVNFGIALRYQDVIEVDLFSAFKATSKELFYSTEKELIGRGALHWEEIEENSSIELSFVPKKQHQLKSNKNSLISMQQSFKIALSYTIQPYNPEPRSQPLSLKRKITDLDVLSSGLLTLNLCQCLATYQNATIVQIEFSQWNMPFTAQSTLKLNQLSYLKAKNMEISIGAVLTLKDRDKYLKKHIKCKTSLRGKHYRIHQQIPLFLNFEDQLMLQATGVIFYNCFAGAPQGKLTLQEVAFRGAKIDRFELGFIENINFSTDKVQPKLKKEGYQLKELELQFLTSDLLNGMYTLVEFKSQKYKFVLPLGQLSIDKYEQSQICQKQVLVGGQALVISFKLRYAFSKQNQKLQEQIAYVLLGTEPQRDLKVRYNQKEIAYFKEDQQNSKLVPKRTKGYAGKVTIPEQLMPETKSVELYLQNGQKMVLTPSAIRPRQYLYYTDKKYKPTNLKLNHPQFQQKIVQSLGDAKGVDKFMIDQNSKFICTHSISEKQILDIAKETWTFKFKLHRILALSRKRLLHLKNTVHDEVLTKKLALLLKHSGQCQLIFDLDQFGAIQDKEVEVQFGYNSSSQILEVYLVIDNYFNRRHQKNVERLMSNWMELMPISYGTVDLSDIGSNKYIGFKLEPLSNHSINLQKFISNLIVREDNIFALGGLTFHKKAWGYLSITLLNCTAIDLQRRNPKETVYIYFKVELQDSNRAALSTLTTQARSILNQKGIKFTHNNFQLLLIEQGEEPHYNLKITGCLLVESNHCVLFQKRQDITDILHKRGHSELNIQIKVNETNQVSKNSFQLAFSIENGVCRPQRANLIARAQQINKVDALSFRDMTGLQFLEKLLGCQQLSHFYQCLQEIKESFIYSEDPQTQLFIYLSEYLVFNFDSKVLSLICEIIQLTVLKAPIVILQMQKRGLIPKLYSQLKTICKSQTPQIPQEIVKISDEEYNTALDLFQQKQSIETIRQVIFKQKYILYSGQRLLDRPSAKCNQLILMILDIVLGHSATSRSAFQADIEEWIEIFGFCQDQEEFQLFLLLFKNSTQHGLILPQKVLLRLIDILLQRVYRLTYVYDFWIKVQERQQKIDFYKQILIKYQNQLQVNPIETCRGVKLMLSHLYDPKAQQQIYKMHQQIIKSILTSLQQSTEIVHLSSNIDLLLYFSQIKTLGQNERNVIANIIKEKSSGFKDNSSKIILGGFTAKLHKGKQVKLVPKKEGKGSQAMQKAGFRTKYLITSD